MFSSIVNLQCMIDICAENGLIMGITFSHFKSNCLALYPHPSHIPISSKNVNGVNLLWVKKMRYLRIYVTNDCKNLFDMSKPITKFYGSVHSMICSD